MTERIISIGSEHAGFDLKSKIISVLNKEFYKLEDLGIYEKKPSDIYPFIAEKVAVSVAAKKTDCGILICGTGIGMCISANKVYGIRAALCHDEYTAVKSREHNDANILVIGSRVVDEELAIKIVHDWLSTKFTGDRHISRLENIKKIDLKYRKPV
ncbi:MAG: ribose 5-phosphate isomerase B [Actinobacteria bacterium]|nr:ribose 5-phosphate isomerase B [Actinomycetota bacterium]